MEHYSGMAQQMSSHDFEMAPSIASDRRKRKHEDKGEELIRDGFYYSGLNERLRESLILFARKMCMHAGKESDRDLLAQEEARAERREQKAQEALKQAISKYAYAVELFSSWQAQGAQTQREVEAFLRGKPEVQKLEFLRKQIEMRVIGLGWEQFATSWSSSADNNIGTVSHLQLLLVEKILPYETNLRNKNELPDVAEPTQGKKALVLKKLGTTDEDFVEIESKVHLSSDEIQKLIDAEMQRRVESGIQDEVEYVQPLQAPKFTQALVGKRLEICWRYFLNGEPQLIWTPVRVARVADGLTDKTSSRARKILPAGMLLIAWDADADHEEHAGEKWMALLPAKWNQKKVYGWRYDPRELQSETSSNGDASSSSDEQTSSRNQRPRRADPVNYENCDDASDVDE